MEDFNICALWGPRPEQPEQIAQRIRSLLAELRPITPEFARWYQVIADDNVPELDETETWLASVVASDVCRGDLGEPIPYLGYFPVTTNNPSVFSKCVGDVGIATKAGSHMMFNSVDLRSCNGLDLPPALVTYPIVRKTVLALSRAFEPLCPRPGPTASMRVW